MWAAALVAAGLMAAGLMAAAEPVGSTGLDVGLDIGLDAPVLVAPTAVESVRATSVAVLLDGSPGLGSAVDEMTGAD